MKRVAVLTLLSIATSVATLAAPPQDDPDADAWNVRALARLRSPPLGLPPVSTSGDLPTSEALVGLGRKLFFDRRLSVNGTMSCGMCHIPEQGFTSNELATPVGVNGRSLRRNAPTVLNVAYLDTVFLDGRSPSLEAQATEPLLARDEMDNPSSEALVKRLQSIPEYAAAFRSVFEGPVTMDRIATAVAAWERSLLGGNSRFDRWRYGGEKDLLSATEQRGFELFTGKASCSQCHTVGEEHALFSDQEFHDTGVAFRRENRKKQPELVRVEIAPGVFVSVTAEFVRQVEDPTPQDLGRFEVTAVESDRWRFRTPTLRDVASTAPYMHDGSLATLEDVVRFYNHGGEQHTALDPLVRPLGLDENEVTAIAAFLGTLTSGNLKTLQADARSTAVGN